MRTQAGHNRQGPSLPDLGDEVLHRLDVLRADGVELPFRARGKPLHAPRETEHHDRRPRRAQERWEVAQRLPDVRALFGRAAAAVAEAVSQRPAELCSPTAVAPGPVSGRDAVAEDQQARPAGGAHDVAGRGRPAAGIEAEAVGQNLAKVTVVHDHVQLALLCSGLSAKAGGHLAVGAVGLPLGRAVGGEADVLVLGGGGARADLKFQGAACPNRVVLGRGRQRNTPALRIPRPQRLAAAHHDERVPEARLCTDSEGDLA
mmetsp:Transcript_21800/g.54532  ORF Transcript_21800/g.54532 Transcript_21800/m.54532 type:complete len:260 (+) Transcript_21800:1726-2505(+)